MDSSKRTLPATPTIAALVAVAVVLAAAVGTAMAPRPVAGTTPITLADLGRRVLVVATHPDDEVLMAGGAVSELVAEGAEVRVVIATAGDGYYSAAKQLAPDLSGPALYLRLGEQRHAESLAAAARLGLPAADMLPLGYSDGGGSAMWDTAWDRSHAYTGRPGLDAVPYTWAFARGSAECGQDFAADLASIVSAFRPDTVIAPDARETNLDHSGVAALTMYALDDAGFTGRLLTAVVHFKAFPKPWAFLPGSSLAPPPHLIGSGATWLALPLDATAEQAEHVAFEEYRSQTEVTALSWYLRSFVRRNELFCERRPSRPATAATDARPGPGAAGVIAVTPLPVIAPAVPNPGRVRALRMVRGPHTLWLGIVCDGPVQPGAEFRAGLRLLGGRSGPQRLDILVKDGGAKAVRVANDSIAPGGITAAADGDTLWISLPATVLGGRTRALAGCSCLLAGHGSARTPWVDVRL